MSNCTHLSASTQLFFLPFFFFFFLCKIGRPPSACFDPVKSSPSLPGYRKKSLWLFFCLETVQESLEVMLPTKGVPHRMTSIWPSFDMDMPQVTTSERICDVTAAAAFHRHLSKIWMMWSKWKFYIIVSFIIPLCDGIPLRHFGEPLVIFGVFFMHLIQCRHANKIEATSLASTLKT